METEREIERDRKRESEKVGSVFTCFGRCQVSGQGGYRVTCFVVKLRFSL